MAAMKSAVERLINALSGAEMLAQRKHAEDTAAGRRRCRGVTVSCAYAAQGEELARLPADRLGIHCYDREILDKVARRAQVDVELVMNSDRSSARGMVDLAIAAVHTAGPPLPVSGAALAGMRGG
jgi:hypothetical protein